jgi:hypothetical protein
MMLSVLHPGVTSLALIYSSQLNLFEQFLTQAVSGIDSTSITSGMQNSMAAMCAAWEQASSSMLQRRWW